MERRPWKAETKKFELHYELGELSCQTASEGNHRGALGESRAAVSGPGFTTPRRGFTTPRQGFTTPWQEAYKIVAKSTENGAGRSPNPLLEAISPKKHPFCEHLLLKRSSVSFSQPLFSETPEKCRRCHCRHFYAGTFPALFQRRGLPPST